jgi:archaemetzincin
MKVPSFLLLLSLLLFTTFVHQPNVELPKEKTVVYVKTMGNVSKTDLDLVVSTIENFYDFDVVVHGDFTSPDKFKVNGLNRYRASSILSHSNKVNEHLGGKVLILTPLDICTDRKLNGILHKNWGILGVAGLGKQSTIVSTYRMKTNHNNRLSKVVVHELGHSLGIPHCHQGKNCVMNDAKGKGSTVDKSSLYICDDCRKKIL